MVVLWAEIRSVKTVYSVGGGDASAPAMEVLIARGVALDQVAPQGSLF